MFSEDFILNYEQIVQGLCKFTVFDRFLARLSHLLRFRPLFLAPFTLNCFSDISTVLIGPKQDTLIKLYQKDLKQLLGYGIYIQMLMILTCNKAGALRL